MPLFCKQCNNRRLPRWMTAEKMTFWICETCKNFVDAEDVIIREDVSEQLPRFSKFDTNFWVGLAIISNRSNFLKCFLG